MCTEVSILMTCGGVWLGVVLATTPARRADRLLFTLALRRSPGQWRLKERYDRKDTLDYGQLYAFRRCTFTFASCWQQFTWKNTWVHA
jgi:hypothetical protein